MSTYLIPNPLADVPLNTKKVYVVATAAHYCTVYMPVDSYIEQLQLDKKAELQAYLDSQGTEEPKTYA